MHKSASCRLGKISNRCETDCFDIIIHRSKKRKYRLSRYCLAGCWFWKIRISLLYCHYAQFPSFKMYLMHNVRNNVTNNVIILFSTIKSKKMILKKSRFAPGEYFWTPTYLKWWPEWVSSLLYNEKNNGTRNVTLTVTINKTK